MISQNLDDHPAPLRKLLKSALDQGAELVQVVWDPEGGQFNRGRARIIVLYDGVLIENSGSGWVTAEGHFRLEISIAGPLEEAEAQALMERLKAAN